jgi:hypothetical protein
VRVGLRLRTDQSQDKAAGGGKELLDPAAAYRRRTGQDGDDRLKPVLVAAG